MLITKIAVTAALLLLVQLGNASLLGNSAEDRDEPDVGFQKQNVFVGDEYLLRGLDQGARRMINPDIEWRWSVECEDGAITCDPAPQQCDEGFAWQGGLDRRTRTPGGEWTPWVKLANGRCAAVAEPSVDAATVAREFLEFPLPELQPATQPVGYAIVNLPTILHVTPQHFSEHVLVAGHSILVEAWPVQYTWDPGDGAASIVTDHPGAVYPNETITHTYTERQQVTLTLTTTWAGRFQTATSGWVDIPGTATTTSKLPLDVKVVRAYLVGEEEAG